MMSYAGVGEDFSSFGTVFSCVHAMRSFLKNTILFWSLFAGFSSVLSSCVRLYSNDLSQENHHFVAPRFLTEHDIALYADSINTILPSCEEIKSMVYSLEDYSFQVSKYLHHGKTVLYVERGNSGESGRIEKRFYIEDKTPVLLVERSVDNTKAIKYSKTYFREGKVFITKVRPEFGEMEIQDASYKGTETSTDADHYHALETYEDAINQRRKFDLFFEEIAECPKAKYLILSRKEINSYRAPVKVEVEDEFIHELYSNPLRYRGEKLDISWRMNANNEAVYSHGKLKTRD